MAESRRPNIPLIALIVAALIGAIFVAAQRVSEQGKDDVATTPLLLEEPGDGGESPTNLDSPAPPEGVAEKRQALAETQRSAHAADEIAAPAAPPPDPGNSSWNDGNPDAAEIDRAIARARSIQALEAGILAARANPGPPPEIAAAFANPSEVPVELEEAARGPKLDPPEILEMLREERGTPPEIAQAMADALENPTSDEFRAYMAGKADKPVED